eukprot:COSAG02_NODE_96_length_37408_cov_9.762604_18_plen_113_part_00
MCDQQEEPDRTDRAGLTVRMTLDWAGGKSVENSEVSVEPTKLRSATLRHAEASLPLPPCWGWGTVTRAVLEGIEAGCEEGGREGAGREGGGGCVLGGVAVGENRFGRESTWR